ncbi:type A2 lantipeptide [Streptomyces cyaneofuscatus]|uniref:type A2 lantipeptide n=1 Tax=Streptomyces cyaneofuscatus TaxID=66883 RepID=UPI0033B7A862
MNSTPQVPTQVISDADLDNVSGGILNGSLNNNALGLAADAPVSLSGALQAATGLTCRVSRVSSRVSDPAVCR